MNLTKISRAIDLANEGDFAQAKKILAKVLRSSPRNPQALYALGATHLAENNYPEAIKYLKVALKEEPRYVDAISSLGLAYFWTKNYALAEQQFRQAIEIEPNNPGALFKMGTFCMDLGRSEEAKQYLLKLLELAPDDANTLNNLGKVYSQTRDLAKSVECYQRAFSQDRNNITVFANLISSLRLLRLGDVAYPIVLEKVNQPNLGVALFAIFASIRNYAMWECSDQILREIFGYLKTTQLRGLDPALFFEINIYMLSTQEVDDDALFWIHKTAGSVLEDRRSRVPYSSFPHAMKPTKHWRIGYLSPDFRHHAVNTSLRALVNERDRDLFEVYCYSNAANEDYITEQYRASADAFVNVSLMSDAQLAERIQQDGIHFLVDLAGYTQHGRLGVMAYRPAPVQIVYMGYPYTSGMTEVDYFISDPYLNGPKNAAYFTEQQLQLPECFTSFDRLAEQVIMETVPCRRNGYITFGSLNNIYKLNPKVIGIWARIIQATPGSRLIINHPHCTQTIVRENLYKEFLKNGIEQERIKIIWEQHPDKSHLRYYNDIDIALDTFPLTGGTTTIDAIWMGVPVVTLAGDIYPRRISYSILKNVGIELDDLIAFSEEEYLQKSIALARNPERISELRRAIPESLQTSILCDSVRMTRQIENAYLQAWDEKFPERPVTSHHQENDALEYVPLRTGTELAVMRSLDDMACYVSKEQGGWFEDEYDFVLGLARHGMQVLDVGAGIGFYALPLAAKIGSGTLWAAVKMPGEARLLHASITHNQLQNLKLLVEGDRKLKLDVEMDKGGLGRVDFVRLNINATAGDLLDDAADFFNTNSPLVMFGIKRDNQAVDTSLASQFKGMGYEIYRLIPGLGMLAPFISDDELDVFAMNLFACKKDRAASLEMEGKLTREIRSQKELPGIHIKDWQAYLAGFSYSAKLMDFWLSQPKQQDWEVYWVALNLYAQAKDVHRTPDERFTGLQSSIGILMMLAQAALSLPRLLTLCRALTDAGRREAAVNILNQIAAMIESGAQLDLNEPFLALTEGFASVDPGERLAEWLYASILEQREKLRSFSTFFTAEESLPTLETIFTTGFQGEETEQRIDLIKRRAAGHS